MNIFWTLLTFFLNISITLCERLSANVPNRGSKKHPLHFLLLYYFCWNSPFWLLPSLCLILNSRGLMVYLQTMLTGLQNLGSSNKHRYMCIMAASVHLASNLTFMPHINPNRIVKLNP